MPANHGIITKYHSQDSKFNGTVIHCPRPLVFFYRMLQNLDLPTKTINQNNHPKGANSKEKTIKQTQAMKT